MHLVRNSIHHQKFRYSNMDRICQEVHHNIFVISFCSNLQHGQCFSQLTSFFICSQINTFIFVFSLSHNRVICFSYEHSIALLITVVIQFLNSSGKSALKTWKSSITRTFIFGSIFHT